MFFFAYLNEKFTSCVFVAVTILIFFVIPLYKDRKYKLCNRQDKSQSSIFVSKMSTRCRKFVRALCLLLIVLAFILIVLKEYLGAISITNYSLYCTLIFKINDRHTVFEESSRGYSRKPPLEPFASILIMPMFLIMGIVFNIFKDYPDENLMKNSALLLIPTIIFLLVDFAFSIYYYIYKLVKRNKPLL